MFHYFCVVLRDLLQKLNEPYAHDDSFKHYLKITLTIGFGIFLFLFIFKPFGMDTAKGPFKVLLPALYGLITMVVMLLNRGLSRLAKPVFDEERWTLWKEIVWAAFNFATIATANYAFSVVFYNSQMSWATYGSVMYITVVVGIIPLMLVIFGLQIIRLKRNLKAARELSSELAGAEQPDDEQVISFESENGQDKLDLRPDQVVYIESDNNYVEIRFVMGNEIKRSVMRNSLKRMEQSLEPYPYLFRNHRRYISNLRRVKRVIGNAQGYRLVLEPNGIELPVSRQKAGDLRNRIHAIATSG